MCLGVGMGMVESVPWNSPPMYSRIVRATARQRSARRDWPASSALAIGDVDRLAVAGEPRPRSGYQPVGMKPSGALPPGSLTLTTARLLVLALATNSIDSSGESASDTGVLPGGALGSMAVPIVSTALPASVSMTVTVLRLALAT